MDEEAVVNRKDHYAQPRKLVENDLGDAGFQEHPVIPEFLARRQHGLVHVIHACHDLSEPWCARPQ
jgi:hypothetical protein